MNLRTRELAWMSFLAVATASVAWGQTTQPADQFEPGKGKIGVVTGNRVYVRSGDSQNYYPVTHLNKGDKVVVVDKRYDWAEILPPKGVHSLIDKTYVDKKSDSLGILNGTTTVYAGSNIDKRRYAKQGKLDKGDRVQILGESDDGKLYKIVPPKQATLWMHGDYVHLTDESRMVDAGAERIGPGGLRIGPGGVPSTQPTTQPSPAEALKPLPKLSAATENEKYQLVIDAVEARIALESSKDADERDYESLLDDLKPLADQDEDKIANVYAETRIKQIKSHMEIKAALKRMRALRTRTITEADRLRAKAKRIKPGVTKPPEKIVVRGELMSSSIYDGSGMRPKRWRVVEPGVSPSKTLAYIELPKGSSIDPTEYYQKRVGIIPADRLMLSSTIPPVPIYIVKEIRILGALDSK